MLLVVTRAPDSPDALAAAAQATGLALAEVRMRLAGTLPRSLLSDADRDRVAAAAAALERLDFGVFCCDPTAAPTDDSRVVARSLTLAAGELTVVDGLGNSHDCPASAVAFFIRGTRIATTAKTIKTTDRTLSLGRAALTGGLLWTKKTESTVTKTSEEREEMILLHRRDDQPDIVLYERRLDYRCLGGHVAPSSRANFDALLGRLRAIAPRARFDERILRPGFVAGLPATSVNSLDLALFLVTISLTTQRPAPGG